MTPNAAGDTLTGKVSFAVGGSTQSSIAVSGNISQVRDQLNGTQSFMSAGLTAALNSASNALVITGPHGGVNAAANTVDFSGTTLQDLVGASLTVTNGVAGAPPSGSTSSLAFSGTGVVAGDSISGSLTIR